MKLIKNLDLKSLLTIISVLSLVTFVGIILFKIEMNKEIAMLFFGVFITLINRITDYYFTRKDKENSNNIKGEEK